jgi:hypothetical protein
MKKININKKNTFFIVVIIVLIAVLLIAVETIISLNITNKQKQTADYTLWLSKNCVCLEENLLSCPEGFKLVGKLCLQKENITPTLKSCSKYDCSGKIKLFDVDSQKWQSQN